MKYKPIGTPTEPSAGSSLRILGNKKNAPITHRMAVHKKRIVNSHFILTLNWQFSTWAYLSRWRMRVMRTPYILRTFQVYPINS